MENQQKRGQKSQRNGADGGPLKRPRVAASSRKTIGEGQLDCRLLVPTRVSGRVIGKGGENVKRLRTEFNANVSIPDSSAPERIVSIVADPESAIKVADDIFSKIVESRPKDVHDEREEIKLLIHKSQAGAVIGKGGGKIKEIKEATSANVKVFGEVCPMSTDRVVNIQGEKTAMLEALKLVLNLILENPIRGNESQYDSNNYTGINVAEYGGYPPDRNWQGPPVNFQGGGQNFMGSPGFNNPMMMGGMNPIQNPMMQFPNGSMMGMGGPMNMGMMGAPTAPQMGMMNPMGMGFPSPAMAAAPAVPKIEPGIAYGASPTKGNTLGGPTPLMPPGSDVPPPESEQTVQQVTIPKELAGAVIGRGGEHLNRIKRQSGAHVIVEPLEEGANDRIITMKGTQQGIQMAQYLLQECVRASNFGKRF